MSWRRASCRRSRWSSGRAPAAPCTRRRSPTSRSWSKGTSYMFVTGPNVVKTVTHEDVDAEFLGGAATHTTRSGVAHLAAPDEAECARCGPRDPVRICRRTTSPSRRVSRRPTRRDRMDVALDAIVPDDPRTPYDMHDVLRRVVDDGAFLEIQPAGRRTSSSGSRGSAGGASASSRSNPRCWPARWTSTHRSRPRDSSGPAMRSTSRSSRSSTSRGSCPVSGRSTAGSSATGRSCCTPTARRPSRSSPSSPARRTAARTTS